MRGCPAPPRRPASPRPPRRSPEQSWHAVAIQPSSRMKQRRLRRCPAVNCRAPSTPVSSVPVSSVPTSSVPTSLVPASPARALVPRKALRWQGLRPPAIVAPRSNRPQAWPASARSGSGRPGSGQWAWCRWPDCPAKRQGPPTGQRPRRESTERSVTERQYACKRPTSAAISTTRTTGYSRPSPMRPPSPHLYDEQGASFFCSAGGNETFDWLMTCGQRKGPAGGTRSRRHVAAIPTGPAADKPPLPLLNGWQRTASAGPNPSWMPAAFRRQKSADRESKNVRGAPIERPKLDVAEAQ